MKFRGAFKKFSMVPVLATSLQPLKGHPHSHRPHLKGSLSSPAEGWAALAAAVLALCLRQLLGAAALVAVLWWFATALVVGACPSMAGCPAVLGAWEAAGPAVLAAWAAGGPAVLAASKALDHRIPSLPIVDHRSPSLPTSTKDIS
jgi:hypothetical protein